MSERCGDDPATRAALARVDALEEQGDLVAALDALVQVDGPPQSATLERRLVRLRRAAFSQLGSASVPWPPDTFSTVEPASPGGFEVTPAEFDTETLATGILRHGHVLVRGLVPPERVARLRDAVDRTFDAHYEVARGAATPQTQSWCDPLEDVPDIAAHRFMVRAAAGILTADSPRALFELLETIRALGIDRMIAEYFGERPALSVKKCTLRRLRLLDWRVYWKLFLSNWHQDGSFLGPGIRTVNAWFALSHCGRHAPGMQLVPARLDRLLAAGERGAIFDWTVSRRTIARALPGIPIWEPEFEPGDVLFFDHWCLHRTAPKLWQWRSRYAIETWFFAPSVYADDPRTALVV